MREHPHGEFDFCVLGESLLNHYIGAILATKGYKVVILDKNQLGTSDYNTFDLGSLLEFIKAHDSKSFYSFDCSDYEMCNTHNAPSTVEVSSMLLDEPENVNFHCISRLGRKFMIDLFPFVIPADGLTVNGIIDLDISHHINVFSPTSLMIYVDEVGKFNKVPLNRNQVFASDCLSLEQKNSFTKFIKNCLTDTGSENVELDDFYKVHRITHPLDDFLEFSVLSEWNTASDKRYSKYDLISGLENTLRSVRRFNTNSKYLMSFNGSQDLAHCFLRKASVMGATVCYGADIKDINDHQSCYHIGFGEDQYLNAKYIIMDHSYSYLLPKETDVEKRIFENGAHFSHCIVITTCDRECIEKKEESATFFSFMVIPKGKTESNHVWIIKFGSGNMCPIGTNLVYFCCVQNKTPRYDLQLAIDKYLKTRPIKVLWTCFYASKHSSSQNCWFEATPNYPRIFINNCLLSTSISDSVIKQADDMIKDILCSFQEENIKPT